MSSQVSNSNTFANRAGFGRDETKTYPPEKVVAGIYSVSSSLFSALSKVSGGSEYSDIKGFSAAFGTIAGDLSKAPAPQTEGGKDLRLAISDVANGFYTSNGTNQAHRAVLLRDDDDEEFVRLCLEKLREVKSASDAPKLLAAVGEMIEWICKLSCTTERQEALAVSISLRAAEFLSDQLQAHATANSPY